MYRNLSALALALLLAGPLAAQQANPLSLSPGDWIRLPAPTLHDQVALARVVWFDESEIQFRLQGRPEVVYSRAYTDIDTIDVRRRYRRYSARSGALWGAYLGAAAGIIAGPFAAGSLSLDTGKAVALLGAVGGVSGGVGGWLAGSVLAPPNWYRHVFAPGGPGLTSAAP